MSKKRPKKTRKKPPSGQPRTAPAKQRPKYSPGEIAMAVLGAALVIMVAAIIITSIFE
jgi:hypothetical protein